MYSRHDDAAFDNRPASKPDVGFLEWLKRLQRARIERHAEAALASMDEHLLRDIGARRGDLARLVRKGRD